MRCVRRLNRAAAARSVAEQQVNEAVDVKNVAHVVTVAVARRAMIDRDDRVAAAGSATLILTGSVFGGRSVSLLSGML